MRQTTGLTSTYSSDEFGICSALYELGGMVVMHDASGCNSTYTTHDEPRWYDMDSMIFISAISEAEAIMGDDDKFIDDLIETAEELHPKFIALVGAPIPYMIGTDLDAIARIVSGRTGLPCFAFAANGMHDYTRGVSMAMERIVREYAVIIDDSNLARSQSVNPASSDPGKVKKESKSIELQQTQTPQGTINILGATPLDFSLNGSVESMRKWVADHDMKMGLCLSMGCSLEEIERAGNAQVNLVVSAGGVAAAKLLENRFGTPYVVGVPLGERFAEFLAEAMRTASKSVENVISYLQSLPSEETVHKKTKDNLNGNLTRCCAIIGEAVFSASLAAAIEMEHEIRAEVLCPLDVGGDLLRPKDHYTPEEDDLIRLLEKYDVVIADPLYRPLSRRKGQKFYPLPHEAFSGRIYDSVNPNLIAKRL